MRSEPRELAMARAWAERAGGRAGIATAAVPLTEGDPVDPCGKGLVGAAVAEVPYGVAAATVAAGELVPVVFTPPPRPDLDATWSGPRCAICGGRAVKSIYRRRGSDPVTLVHVDSEDWAGRPHEVWTPGD